MKSNAALAVQYPGESAPLSKADSLKARQAELNGEINAIDAEVRRCRAALAQAESHMTSTQARLNTATGDVLFRVSADLKQAAVAKAAAADALQAAEQRQGEVPKLQAEINVISARLIRIGHEERQAVFNKAVADYELALRNANIWALAGRVRDAARAGGIGIIQAPGLLGGAHGDTELLMINGYPLDIARR